MKYFLVIVTGIILLMAVFVKNKQVISYLPLGDSYTIGTSIDPKDNFPAQLTRDLNDHGIKTNLVINPAHTGWTTQELIDNELPIFDRFSPTFTTLLIGVNDFNRGVSIETFQKNLGIILDHIKSAKIVLITIPNFSVTPTGKAFGDPKYNSEGVQKFNKIVIDEGKKRGLKVVDIFFISADMGKDPTLVASDGLHPSAKEYQIWEKQIFSTTAKILQ